MPRRLHAASHVIRTRPTRGRRRAISSPARVSSSSSAPLEVVACRSTRLSFMTGSRPKTCCAPIRLWSSRLAQPRQSTVRTDRRILEATSAGAVRCRHQHEAGVERAHPSRDRDKVESELQAHLDGATARFKSEHRVLHRDTSHRWILSRATALRHANGRPYRMIGLDTDVSPLNVSAASKRKLLWKLLPSLAVVRMLAGRFLATRHASRH